MIRILLFAFLLLPAVSLAHHPDGTAHDESEADFYPGPITTEPIPGGTFPQRVEDHANTPLPPRQSAVTTLTVQPAGNTAALQLRLQLLLQLVELLQRKLALQTGVPVSTIPPATTDPVEIEVGGERVIEVSTDYVTIYRAGGYRYFETKAIPNHDTGTFPNSGNPNTISEQDLTYRVTLAPQYTGAQTPVRLPGIALNGIPMEPGTAEREGEYNIEGLQDTYNLGMDENNAHVQPTGLYHYHGVPEGYLDTLESSEDLILVGYAADGFPMYHDHSSEYTSGWELVDERSDGSEADGTYTQDFEFTDTGTLDECNGAWIDDNTYAYFITDEFPYISRCLNGTPDSSFEKGRGPQAETTRPLGIPVWQ